MPPIGKYFADVWTIIHFLSGVLAGYIAIFFDFPFVQSLIVLFVLNVLWEILEVYGKVPEVISNRITDIIVGILGFLLIYEYLVDLEVMYNVFIFAFSFIGYMSWVIPAWLRRLGYIETKFDR